MVNLRLPEEDLMVLASEYHNTAVQLIMSSLSGQKYNFGIALVVLLTLINVETFKAPILENYGKSDKEVGSPLYRLCAHDERAANYRRTKQFSGFYCMDADYFLVVIDAGQDIKNVSHQRVRRLTPPRIGHGLILPHLGDRGTGIRVCSNCDKAHTICEGVNDKGLRIKFSTVGQRQTRRRKCKKRDSSAAARAASRSNPKNFSEASACEYEASGARLGSTGPDLAVLHGRGDNHSLREAQGSSSILPHPCQGFRATSSLSSIAAKLPLIHHQPLPETELGRYDNAVQTPESPGATSLYSLLKVPPDVWNDGSIVTWDRPQNPPHASILEGDSASISNDTDPPYILPFSEEEAILVKYFFNVLVYWFDYCDPQMHFRTYVGTAISTDVTIRYAVLAICSRHREICLGVEVGKWMEYERRCLEALIPSLTDTTKEPLASAILLRLLNEMTEPTEAEPTSVHAVTAPVLLRISQGSQQSSSTFRDAAMIVALRQEIFFSNLLKRAVGPIADYRSFNPSFEPASDMVWAYRIIAHAARVTNFAYGTDAKSTHRWDQLWQFLCDWDHQKPVSLQPIYTSNWQDAETSTGADYTGRHQITNGSLYTALYTYDCPIAAQQYYQLCRILLLAHDPRTPTLGVGRAEFQQKREGEIREAVRNICSISISNPEYAPAKLTAGLAIAMCGELFTDAGETRQFLRILSDAELHLGWPHLKVSSKLESFWGLSDVDVEG